MFCQGTHSVLTEYCLTSVTVAWLLSTRCIITTRSGCILVDSDPSLCARLGLDCNSKPALGSSERHHHVQHLQQLAQCQLHWHSTPLCLKNANAVSRWLAFLSRLPDPQQQVHMKASFLSISNLHVCAWSTAADSSQYLLASRSHTSHELAAGQLESAVMVTTSCFSSAGPANNTASMALGTCIYHLDSLYWGTDSWQCVPESSGGNVHPGLAAAWL